MNQTLMFLQADMHRAINDGQKSLVVSVLDLNELLAVVAKVEGREMVERVGHGFAFIRPGKLQDLKGGRSMYCTIRLRKNDEFSEQIFCLPKGKPELDVVAQTEQNTPLQNGD